MSDILAMCGITVFSSQNIVHISISLSSSACKFSICMYESRAHETFNESSELA